MWKLHRYYLKEVTASALLTFTVLFGIVLMASVYRGIDRAKGGDLLLAAVATLLFAADAFQHLLTVSLLMASVMVFARASQEREITAIRAAGISPRVPMVPAVLVGILFAILGSAAQHYLIPWTHYHKYRAVNEVVRNFLVNMNVSGNKMAFGRTMISWGGRAEDGTLHDVLIRVGGRGRESAGDLYYADRARLDLSRDGAALTLSLTNFEDLLQSGIETETPGQLDLSFALAAFTEDSRRHESDKDMTSDQLLAEVYEGRHPEPDRARFTVHQRACFGLMPFLFTPLGFCIGVLARDRGRMTAMIMAIVPITIFYVCVFMSPSLLRLTDWPSVAFLPAIVVAVLGVPFCWRLLRV